jgi:hypothetical protein
MISNWKNWLLENEATTKAVKLYDLKLYSLSELMKIPDFIKTGLEDEVLDTKNSESFTDYDYEERRSFFLRDCKLIAADLKSRPKDLYVVFFGWPHEHGFKMTLDEGPLRSNSSQIKIEGNRYEFWYDIVGETYKPNYPNREINGVRKNCDYVKLNINPQLHFVIYDLVSTWVDERVLIMKKETVELLEALSDVPVDKAKEMISTTLKKPVDIENFRKEHRGRIMGGKYGL